MGVAAQGCKLTVGQLGVPMLASMATPQFAKGVRQAGQIDDVHIERIIMACTAHGSSPEHSGLVASPTAYPLCMATSDAVRACPTCWPSLARVGRIFTRQGGSKPPPMRIIMEQAAERPE